MLIITIEAKSSKLCGSP